MTSHSTVLRRRPAASRHVSSTLGPWHFALLVATLLLLALLLAIPFLPFRGNLGL
jgi:hypothetical protein